MATIENFLLRFKVEGQGAVDKASAGIKNLSDQVSQFGANTGPLNNALAGILGRLGPIGAAAGAAAGAFAALGLQAVNLAAEISDIAGATGIAEGTLLNFRTSVIEAGGKADDFGQIAAKLNQNVQEAAGGNEKLQDSFRKLGVFVTDASGKIRSTEDILRDITDRFQQGTLTGAEYSAAVDLLGKNITKLDLTKLQALSDPIKDAEIRKLDEYSAAIDRVRDRLERKVVSFFGQIALDIDNAYEKADKIEKKFEEMGRKTYLGPGLRGFLNSILGREPTEPVLSREMTPEERAARDRKAYEDQMARLMAPYRTRAPAEETGGFGVADPDRLKREAEQRRKEAERAADALAKELQTIKDMTAGYQRSSEYNLKRYELQRSLLGATEYERDLVMGRSEIEKRYADQIAALEAKKATAKDQTLKLINESITALQQQQEKELAGFDLTQKTTFEYNQQLESVKRITDEIERQIRSQESLGDVLRGINDQRVDRAFEASLKGLSPRAREVAKIQEEARKAALSAGRTFAGTFEDSGDGLSAERAQELAEGLAQIAAGFKSIADEQIATITQNDEFTQSLLDSYERYKEDAMDASKQVANSFENFTGGMEDAFVRFVQTGKLSFKDLANSILADLARIAVKKAMVFLGTSLFGFANGGQVMEDTPIVVGERGPELFVPKTAGTIIANNKLGSAGSSRESGQTNVTYNIQAVDAASFRSLVARDPSFIYSVTEQGRRSQPTRSR